MPSRKKMDVVSWYEQQAVLEREVCPLCEREIPASQRDEHHLVPKSKGGKVTQHVHRICHRQIHALFSEAELEKRYSTVESLLTHPEMRKFVDWVKKKPPEFIDGAKRSSRRKMGLRLDEG